MNRNSQFNEALQPYPPDGSGDQDPQRSRTRSSSRHRRSRSSARREKPRLSVVPPRSGSSARQGSGDGLSRASQEFLQDRLSRFGRSLGSNPARSGRSRPAIPSSESAGIASVPESPASRLPQPYGEPGRTASPTRRRSNPASPAPTANPTRRRSTRRTSTLFAPSDGVNPYTPTARGTTGRESETSTRSGAVRQRKKAFAPLLYMARLLILGVGIGVIAGTALSYWDPTGQLAGAGKQESTTEQTQVQTQTLAEKTLQLKQELLPLKTAIQTLATEQSDLMAGVFLSDLDTGSYVDINGSTPFAAASTIKVPVLVAFFQDIDAGKIRLDEMLTMKPELIASGSGDLQYQQAGSQYSALETATLMITISDNTATNMLIDRLGGREALNQRFKAWGLTQTVIHNPLPDLEGTNTSSPKDMVALMAMVNQGELVSLRSRDRLLDIMRRTETNTLLTPGLGEGATIAHKTGDIGSMVGDVGLIDLPNGKRYLETVFVKRPHNDNRAQELIRQISRVSYDAMKQETPASPAATVVSPERSAGASLTPGTDRQNAPGTATTTNQGLPAPGDTTVDSGTEPPATSPSPTESTNTPTTP